MSIFKFLQGIGDRLGILEMTSGGTVPQRIQTRIVTLRELTIEIRSAEVQALADSPVELEIPFEKIFDTAGISSDPQNWTIDRLKQVVSSEAFKNKPLEEARKSVLDMLKAEGVAAEEIVKDAIARDHALDSFEACMSEKMQDRTDACKKKLAEIEAQIKDLQEASARLEEKLKTDEERWREWRKSKRARERELASIASYIVDHPAITTDDEDTG
jgi:hypothetical protein